MDYPDIIYAAFGGQPLIDARLHIAPDGQADLYIGSSWSLPPDLSDKAGYFAGVVSAESLTAVQKLIAAMPAPSPASPMPPQPGMVMRSLVLTKEGQQTAVSLATVTPESELGQIEAALQGIMQELSHSPTSAVQLSSEMPIANGTLTPQITLTTLGTEPMKLLFWDETAVNWSLGAVATLEKQHTLSPGSFMWLPVSSNRTPREAIEALVQAGSLPSGEQSFTAGKSIRFSLPGITLPTPTTSLSFYLTLNFWQITAQGQRKQIVLQTPRFSLP